jgi:hypothetical protein
MSIKPEDMIPDAADFVEKQGINIRKGTAAAILANAGILMDSQATDADKAAALETIRELMPAMVAAGMHLHMTWNNPEIQKIMEQVVRQTAR